MDGHRQKPGGHHEQAASLHPAFRSERHALAAQTATLRPDQTEFRALYKELVETDTTLSAAKRGEGSCTLAATRMAARLKAAGMADSQLIRPGPRQRVL